MGFIKTGISAIGKLFIVVALAGTFIVGLFGVVYLSLRGEEVKIPEIVGKDFRESEKELDALGLKIREVAKRYSQEKPNTILEQRPGAGEPGKTGLMISVIVAEANPDGQEAPATIVKEEEEAETTADLEIPSDKNKKTNKNANVKKAAQTTRDVVSNKSDSNSNTASDTGNKNSSSTNSKSNSGSPATPANKTNPATPANKSTTTPSNTPKPGAAKTPTSGGDVRTRRVP